MRRFVRGVIAVLFMLAAVPAYAEEPPHPTFDPAPPGQVVQSQLVYLAGEAMHNQWRGVLSKKRVATSGGAAVYQWYLSLYAIDGTVYHLKYRSPAQPHPFDAVAKAEGSDHWFPWQHARIVGASELMGPGAQELVVESQSIGADCGLARVDVFFFDAALQTVMTTPGIQNYCGLQAAIVHGAQGDALAVTGPLYGPKTPLCCPLKPKATAILRFHNGTWEQSPRATFTVVNP